MSTTSTPPTLDIEGLSPPAHPDDIDPSLPVPTDSAEPFEPSPETVAALLADLADPTFSLRALARAYRTTLGALTVFLARPDIAARIDLIESAYARHARFVATAHLPAAARYLTHLLDEQVQIVAHSPVRPDSHKALEARRRTLESTRRAAALLLRIAKFTPGPMRTPRRRHAADEPSPPSLPSSPPPANPRVSPSPTSPRLNRSTENNSHRITSSPPHLLTPTSSSPLTPATTPRTPPP